MYGTKLETIRNIHSEGRMAILDVEPQVGWPVATIFARKFNLSFANVVYFPLHFTRQGFERIYILPALFSLNYE